jgi:hypothetical protein
MHSEVSNESNRMFRAELWDANLWMAPLSQDSGTWPLTRQVSPGHGI